MCADTSRRVVDAERATAPRGSVPPESPSRVRSLSAPPVACPLRLFSTLVTRSRDDSTWLAASKPRARRRSRPWPSRSHCSLARSVSCCRSSTRSTAAPFSRRARSPLAMTCWCVRRWGGREACYRGGNGRTRVRAAAREGEGRGGERAAREALRLGVIFLHLPVADQAARRRHVRAPAAVCRRGFGRQEGRRKERVRRGRGGRSDS